MWCGSHVNGVCAEMRVFMLTCGLFYCSGRCVNSFGDDLPGENTFRAGRGQMLSVFGIKIYEVNVNEEQ